MVLIASFIYLLEGPFFTVFFYEFRILVDDPLRLIMEMSIKTERWIYSGVYFFESFILAAIILLVVGAVFADRSGPVKATN